MDLLATASAAGDADGRDPHHVAQSNQAADLDPEYTLAYPDRLPTPNRDGDSRANCYSDQPTGADVHGDPHAADYLARAGDLQMQSTLSGNAVKDHDCYCYFSRGYGLWTPFLLLLALALAAYWRVRERLAEGWRAHPHG